MTEQQTNEVEDWTHVRQKPHYRLRGRADLGKIPPMQWKVKGLLPASGLAVSYGKPGVGKSFLLFDLGCAIACGEPWFGRKTMASPVIYMCLEGMSGFVSRIKAWEKGHGRELPEHLYVVDAPFNLLSPQDVGALIRAVTECCKSLPQAMGSPVIIVDTLNRAMVGGDENSSRDMGLVWQACGHILAVTNGLVVLNHHPGKESDRGPRGHSSVNATVDASIVVSQSKGQRSWRSEKIKDGPATQPWSFELRPVELGVDEDGEAITSCYVVSGPDASAVEDGFEAKLSKHAQLGFELLNDLSGNTPNVEEHVWRASFIAKVKVDSESGKRNAFNRMKRELSERGMILHLDGGNKVALKQ